METLLNIDFWDGGYMFKSDGALSMAIIDYDSPYSTFIKSVCTNYTDCYANFVLNITDQIVEFGKLSLSSEYSSYTFQSILHDRWSVRMKGIKVDGVEIDISSQDIALIDTSFNVIQVPTVIFDQLVNHFEKYGCYKSRSYIDCPYNATISSKVVLDFDKFKIELTASDLVQPVFTSYIRLNLMMAAGDYMVLGNCVTKKGLLSFHYDLTPEIIFTPYSIK